MGTCVSVGIMKENGAFSSLVERVCVEDCGAGWELVPLTGFTAPTLLFLSGEGAQIAAASSASKLANSSWAAW